MPPHSAVEQTQAREHRWTLARHCVLETGQRANVWMSCRLWQGQTGDIPPWGSLPRTADRTC